MIAMKAGALVVAVCLTLALGTSRTEGGYILETARAGPSPIPAEGLSPLRYIGARFSVSQAVQVDSFGANMSGNSSFFGAIVALSGPDALPQGTPEEIESYALAGTSFVVQPGVTADVTTPLSVLLQPGDYALVIGVGAYGSSGGGNLTTGNIPTAQASFFQGINIIGPSTWLELSTTASLRMYVTGTAVVPEPSALASAAIGTAFLAALAARRRALRGLPRP